MQHDGPWIDILHGDAQTPELLEVYRRFKLQPSAVDHILAIHSLHPESLLGHYTFYRTIMFGPSPLSRAERETLAVAVSSRNGCVY
jgi:hypothetical protein